MNAMKVPDLWLVSDDSKAIDLAFLLIHIAWSRYIR